MKLPALKSREDVDAALRELGQLEIRLKEIETGMQDEIQAITAHAQHDSRPLLDARGAIQAQIRKFADEHEADLKPRRSWTGTFGTIGFRLSRPVIIKAVRTAIERLRTLGLARFVRVTETVNRDGLSAHLIAAPSEELMRLAKAGFTLGKRDNFFCEPDLKRIAREP